MAADKQIKVPKAKFVIDLLGLALWTFFAICFSIAVLLDNTRSELALVVTLIPCLFILISIRDLRNHLRAKSLVILEDGIRQNYLKSGELFEWRAVRQVKEHRNYSGGLTLYGPTPKTRVFIPFGVEDYAEIREFILKRVNLSNSGQISNFKP